MATSRHQPALLGGLFIGVISSLPFVNLLNCCCLWVIVGGLLTAYLQQQNQEAPIDAAQVMLGGLLAGAIGAVISVIANSIVMIWMGPIMQDMIQKFLESRGDVPPELHDAVAKMSGGSLTVFSFLFTVPLYAVFGMLGALLGMAFFKKKTPPVVVQG